MKLPSLEFLAAAFLHVVRRFPMAFLAAVTAVVAVILLIEQQQTHDAPVIKTWLVAQLALPVFTGLAAYSESKNWPVLRQWIAAAVVLAGLVGYWFWLETEGKTFELLEGPRYIGWLVVGHLWVAFAPYLNRLNNSDFWEYNKQLFANFITGALYAFVLWAGLSGAILAVNELFNLHIEGKIYAHLFIVLAGIFNTVFFLFHFPKDFHFDADEMEYTAVFKNLSKFILIPIVALYFLILYAFSLKILITWNLPQGWVSKLVIGFAAAGIFTWLLNFRLPDFDSGSIVRNFKKWFWPVLFPMLALLFVAIARRIWDYGVTEPRFFVAHTGAWLTLCCVFFVFIKSDDIKFIPISLAAFIVVALYGPFSAFESAKRSQTHRLKTIFEKNGFLKNGKLAPVEKFDNAEAAAQIRSSLEFLESRQALSKIEPWLGQAVSQIPAQPDSYSDASKIAQFLKIPWTLAGSLPNHYSVFAERLPQGSIAGFTEFYNLSAYKPMSLEADGVQFSLDETGRSLIYWQGKTELDRFPLEPTMRIWRDSYPEGLTPLPLTAASGKLDLLGKTYTARIFVQNADFEMEGDSLKMSNLAGMIFLKRK